jgi:CheY-like chemotaxis protein
VDGRTAPPRAARDVLSARRPSGGSACDKDSVCRYRMRSKLTLPLVAAGRVVGGLSLVTLAGGRIWPEELVAKLQLVAEVFANALARKETEDALRASELMKSAILASLNSSVGVLDRQGLIIATNQDWARFEPHHGAVANGGMSVGANYLEVCRQAAREGQPQVGDALMKAGAVDFLAKPFDDAALLTAVDHALAKDRKRFAEQEIGDTRPFSTGSAD